jgi:hypothetical protein
MLASALQIQYATMQQKEFYRIPQGNFRILQGFSCFFVACPLAINTVFW